MIKEILFSNFRNLEDKKINLSKGFNLIYGQNAQGKTSFMEAIYFCATGKSFRTKKTSELIKYDKENATVFMKLDNGTTYSINLTKSDKSLYSNSKRIKYLEYIGDILAISFIPEDVELILGEPSIRRDFFNYEISQISKEYLNSILSYQKVLKTRNLLLKENRVNETIFEIYNKEFIKLCVKILKLRKWYVTELNKILDNKYKFLFNEKHKLELKYDNFLKEDSFINAEEKLEEMLMKKLPLDIQKGYTHVGIHKDDFIFELNGKNAKHYSSQGEKKSIVFVIKISEIDIMENLTNKKPIFLMDDITSFFDNFRRNQIISYFLEKEIQCFLTSTEDLNILGKKFDLNKGVIYENFN